MTTEEKAKAYDEALERARKRVATEPQDRTTILKDIFPELAESIEDERIRTFLHHTFTAQYLCKDKTGKWHGEPVTNILAYLEKQKEQIPIKVYRVENEKEQKGLWRKFDGTWEPLFDILTDGLCRDLPMEDNDLYRSDGKQWFASAPSRQTLQKWFSKRDLEELTSAGFTISEFEVRNYKKVSEFEYIFTRDSITKRTYLNVSDIYPEQKPVGWSEEDEQMLIGIIERGNSEIPKGEYALTPYQVAWLETRLKSLRSRPKTLDNWKPSKEQMIVMAKAMLYFGTSWASREQKVLESLYNDLEKQMEE